MFLNTILLAFRAIRRNKMRSFLTILGIIIGVAAVITMVTIGGGATAKVKEQISSLGNNVLMVTVGKRMGAGQSASAPSFKLADVTAMTRDISAVSAAAPIASKSMKAVFGNQNWSTTVRGTDDEYLKVSNTALASGRSFSESEMRAGAAVCLIGETVRTKLFGGQNPIGDRIRLEKLSCEVIGVLASKGQNTMGMDQDDLVVIPVRAYHRRIAGNQDVSLIQVSVRDGLSTEKTKTEIERLMRERRHITSNEEDNFMVMDMKEIANMVTGTTRLLTALLGAVAAVSLLVGGIGIMNIMLVSVTERTREIGIRLAIGALEGEVLMQFLIEAVVLSSLGGVLGILLALAASAVLAQVLDVPFILNSRIIVLSFLFSAAVGVLFGYFPALKAARLDPIEALRYE